MSVASQQHNDITEELQKNFENHSFISIIATNANGNEEFQVTYKVNGLIENSDGDIQVEENHTILLSIPFGFPLFAPNCKPITSTFHPDFDPGAICLGDFWNQDRSCTELIEFISRMIIGEVYSKENAFNEKAARWYDENSQEFPLSVSDNSQARKEIIEEEVVEDKEFSTDFDYLSLEDPDLPEEDFTQAPEYDIEKLQEYVTKKSFYLLDRELNNIPISADFKERDELRSLVDTAFARAQKFQKTGASHEAQSDFVEAKQAYQKALATVSDFYGAREALERVEQAILLGIKPKKKEVVEEEKSAEIDPEVVDTPKARRKPINIKQYFPLLGGGAVIIGLAVLGANIFETYGTIKNIEDTYLRCESAFTKSEFREAKSMCESVTAKKDAGLFFGGKLETLQGKANSILQSEDLTQGIAGKVKINGIWVDKASLDTTSPFEMLLDKTKQIVDEEKWGEASEVLRQATALAKTVDEKKQIVSIRNVIEFKKAAQKAIFVYNKDGCSAAEPYLLKAQQESQSLSTELQKEYLPQVTSYLTECTFNQLISEGNKLYESSDWEQALPIYRDALAKIQNHSAESRISLDEIQQKITKTTLYSTLDNANTAFSEHRWPEAIATYKQAIELIEQQSIGDTRINTQKIERIILQAQVIQAQELGQQYYLQNNYEAAINQQQQIAQYIEQSSFVTDPNFATMKADVPKTIKRYKSEKFIEQKRTELLGKQMDLFVEHYPAANPDTLKDPDVLFISDEGHLITYKMKATETAKGRPLTLVIFYAYNKNTGAWEFAKTPVER